MNEISRIIPWKASSYTIHVRTVCKGELCQVQLGNVQNRLNKRASSTSYCWKREFPQQKGRLSKT